MGVSQFEAPSCAFEGLDKTCAWSGFVITTRPDGEQDFVNSIRLTDACGEGAQDEAELRYIRDGVAPSFILEDGKVVSIEYLAA